MLPGHFKIPGHSGTDFKHKKAFSRQKDYYRKKLKEKSKYNSLDKVNTYKVEFKPTEKKNLVLETVKYIGITITFIGLFWIGSKLFESYKISAKQSIEYHQESKNRTKNEAYNVLTKTGLDYFNSGELDMAQEEFILALKINQNGLDARIGLTKVLQAKCIALNKFCVEFEENLEYLQKTQKISLKTIEEINGRK